jgi:hypothetical protein
MRTAWLAGEAQRLHMRLCDQRAQLQPLRILYDGTMHSRWDVLQQSPMGTDEWAGQLPVVGHWATLFARRIQHKHVLSTTTCMHAQSHCCRLQQPVSMSMLHSDTQCAVGSEAIDSAILMAEARPRKMTNLSTQRGSPWLRSTVATYCVSLKTV